MGWWVMWKTLIRICVGSLGVAEVCSALRNSNATWAVQIPETVFWVFRVWLMWWGVVRHGILWVKGPTLGKHGRNGCFQHKWMVMMVNEPVSKFDTVSAAICDELHWLPIRKRIQFKIALLVWHCIIGVAPKYLIELCHSVSSSSGRQSLRSASRGDLIVPTSKIWLQGFRCLWAPRVELASDRN